MIIGTLMLWGIWNLSTSNENWFFLQHGIEPRFEFGFGLSFTNFEYSRLSITRLPTNEGDIAAAQAWDRGEASAQVQGGSAAAWRVHCIYCAVMSWQLHKGFTVPYTRFPSLSRTLVTSRALNHPNSTSTSRNHPESPLLYYVDLTLFLLAMAKLDEWQWCCQGTIWVFGMLSHRDGGGRRGLLVWLLVLAVATRGWNRLWISIPKIYTSIFELSLGLCQAYCLSPDTGGRCVV